MSDLYDVIVIGSGPAGYISAIRASQLGLKVLCIEKCGLEDDPILGGTCLNVGCIPSKSLLDSSYNFIQAKNLKSHGINIENLSFDLSAMHTRKKNIVADLTAGVKGLFKLNKVNSLRGVASIHGKGNVHLLNGDGANQEFHAKNIIIATGSSPVDLPNIGDGKTHIVSSKEALEFSEVPKNLAVIGAGAIGLEMASVWSRLGSNVTILESMESFLPNVDMAISRQALKVFKKQGLDIQLGSEVLSTVTSNDQVNIRYLQGSENKNLIVDKLIVAVGRKSLVGDLFKDGFEVELDESGFIKVDKFCMTSADNVYAVGDVVGGPMLAHKASKEGVMVAEKIAGKESEINYKTIPAVIYTHPEIAWAGMTEEKALSMGIKISTGSFPFSVNARAMAAGETEGSVKVVIDEYEDKILGVHAIGVSASEIVQQGIIVMNSEVKAEAISSTVFSHPSLSEAFHEAVLSAKGKAIHINNRKKK